MSLQSTLANPLDRLGVLPTTMNWRGGWLETEQYYLYDAVVSPSNSATYILTGQTTLLGGGDPTTNSLWSEFSATASGVQTVTAQDGISNIGTSTNVILDNTGVLTLGVGSGLTLSGSLQNPVLTNNGIIDIIGGNGISVLPVLNPQNINVKKISNTGVIEAVPSTGISVNNVDPTRPLISNTGVLSVIGGTGISIDNPTGTSTITNDGVISFDIVGEGLINTGTSADILLKNTGVLSVQAYSSTSGIIVNNSDPQNPKLASYAPQITQVTDGIDMITTADIPAGSNGTISFTQTTGNLWANTFANGATLGIDAWYVIDLTRFVLSPSAPNIPVGVGVQRINILLSDGTHTYNVGNIILAPGSGYYTPIVLGNCYFRLAAARAAQLNFINSIVIQNNLTIPLYCTNISEINATYYPDGLT